MNKNTQKGFSLIEALVTIAVIGVLGLGLSLLVTRTYKGGAKTELIGDVKQNGQSALDRITSIVRDADAVICKDAPPSADVLYETLVVKSRDGKKIRLFIVPQTNQMNGYIAKQEFTQALDENSTNYCLFNAQFPVNSPSPEILTNNASVSIKSGSFTRSQNPGSKDTVTIQFELGPSTTSGGSFEQNLGGTNNSVLFITSVQLR